jgi:hypothetical protein
MGWRLSDCSFTTWFIATHTKPVSSPLARQDAPHCRSIHAYDPQRQHLVLPQTLPNPTRFDITGPTESPLPTGCTSTAFPWNDSCDDLSKLGSMTHELTPRIGAVSRNRCTRGQRHASCATWKRTPLWRTPLVADGHTAQSGHLSGPCKCARKTLRERILL